MASETNIKLVRAGFEALNAGDLDACIELASPDLIINLAELPEPVHGLDTWCEGAAMIRAAFPDLHAEIEDIFASGDRVAVRLRIRGTHEGDYLGIPATGRTVSYVSHEFYRIENGLIAEEWICSDMAGLFRQIS
ncbi:MAG TPA: ester cyclase [Solirubrobacteraceae bacterium]|nr:ester cyclase [Solirubrobacteraceae bacterium]